MEQELERESQLGTSTMVDTNAEKKTAFENLPRIEDLIKSENEVRTAPKIEGVTEAKTDARDRIFARKEDGTQKIMRKRLKIVKTN